MVVWSRSEDGWTGRWPVYGWRAELSGWKGQGVKKGKTSHFLCSTSSPFYVRRVVMMVNGSGISTSFGQPCPSVRGPRSGTVDTAFTGSSGHGSRSRSGKGGRLRKKERKKRGRKGGAGTGEEVAVGQELVSPKALRWLSFGRWLREETTKDNGRTGERETRQETTTLLGEGGREGGREG